ncbi:unnamed protein product [Hymenolepis diminuta]|uniref:Reverse transcriptase RNase H-like domain-containing protein n=1 Tax=Hymenolepis diminuta TaxID=6216 RepID=A0A564YTQ2_HYMDI|nr:unnamed protein product [Hymenolepis diminuta]
MSNSERNYCATKRELLVVKTFLQHFGHYLLGPREFILRTDHKALTWLHSFKDPEGLIARWQEILAEYHYKLEHRPGSKHGNADALSRIPQELAKVSTIKPSADRSSEWAEAQSKDPYISLIYDRLVHGSDKPSGKEMEGCSLDTRTLWCQRPNLVVKDRVLY